MFWRKPTVLTLGWEYPPYINGGIGVACQGLSIVLARYVHLLMVVPKTNSSSPKNGMKLIGLNQLTDVKKPIEPTFSPKIGLSPYDTTSPPFKTPPLNLTDAQDLHKDIFEKVYTYKDEVLGFAASQSFDFIHAHDWMTFPAALAAQAHLQKPMVAHVHSTEYDRVGDAPRQWVLDIEKETFHKAQFIFTVSHYTAKMLREKYQVPSHKIIPVYNGSDITIKERRKPYFSGKVISFIGRIEPQKNPKGFFAMALQILEQTDNVRFVMAGVGSQLPSIMTLVSQLGLSHKFHFTGFLNRDGVENLLSMTDILVMPSVSEPFGIIGLEAARYGIPSLFSRTSGVTEVLKAALTSDYRDTNLFTEYVMTLLENPDFARDIGIQLSRQSQSLTWEAAAEKVLKCYEILMNHT